ncbi:hypothetical protein SLA2020_037310 [Shorea laevis]
MNPPPQRSTTHALVQAPVPALAPAPVQVQMVSVSAQPPSSSSAPAPAPAPATASSSRIPETLMHKNRLQEYTQRSSLPLPVYTTVNEGQSHAPKFRSTVLVDGATYTSGNTFSVRKAAEQDVAKIALESITKKIKDEGCPLINEDKILCKSILNEFAVKMNLERPTYETTQRNGQLPVFGSSVLFNGERYNGEIGRTKKEAEQLGARAAILSLLGDSCYSTLLTEVIKSKSKLYAVLNGGKGPGYSHQDTQSVGASTSANKDKEIVSTVVTENVPISANVEPSLGQPLPLHQFKSPKPEPSSEPAVLPITFVPQVQSLAEGEGSLKRRRRKSKKKNNKKLCTNAQLPVAMAPVNQAS